MSTVAESAATDQTNAALDQVGTTGALAADQIAKGVAQQSEEEKQARTGISLQQNQNQMQDRIRTQNLLSDLERDKGSLNIEKDRSRLEQLSSNLALQDRKYLDELQREGARKRLNDQLAFDEELTRSAMGNSTDILKQYLGNQSILGANDRAFKRAMGQLSLDDALAMARGNQKAAAEAGKWSAAGGLLNAGIAGASAQKSGKFDSDYQNSQEDGNMESYSSYLKRTGK
jgi:hypothetical protein